MTWRWYRTGATSRSREGGKRIEFQDVSAQIRPENPRRSRRATSASSNRIFDFDLLTPAKLMEKAVGREVTIVRVNPATGAEDAGRKRWFPCHQRRAWC